MKAYKFSFEYKGLIFFLLVMIPNFIWFFNSPKIDPLVNMIAPHAWLDIVMNFSQWIMLAMLCMIVRRKEEKGKSKNLYFVLAVICLLIYYILWIGYFDGLTDKYVLFGMAFFPSLLFVFLILWLKNYWALIPSIIFLMIHIFITWYSFLK